VSQHRRPWWLLVNKPAGLVTTIQEESTPNERIFVIRGEPLVQGLAWLIWGPVTALVVVIALTGLAINFNIREQGGGMRFLFIAAFLILPALAWGVATIVMNRLSARHLQAERDAEAQKCVIRLNQAQGQLIYQIPTADTEEYLAFHQIRGIRATPAIGARDGKSLQLMLHTDRGKIVLLNEALGTTSQKIDLARELEASLRS